MKWMPLYMVLGLLIWTTKAYAYDPCIDTLTHKPRADVAYNDDMSNEITSSMAQTVTIPITIDLAERYDITIPEGADFDANFGFIEIDADGSVFYNGEDISGNIEDKCDDDSGSKNTEGENGDNADTGRELP